MAMPKTPSENPASERDNVAIARHLLRAAETAVLSTRLAEHPADEHRATVANFPYGSLVLTACTQAGAPLMLLSDLAEHCQNLAADDRACLLFDGTLDHDDRLAGPRLSVLGRLTKTTDPAATGRFLRRHPNASIYADFKDFNFYTLHIEQAHLVAGFGRIQWLSAAELAIPPIAALATTAGEAEVIAHMNDDHPAAILAYAEDLLGQQPNDCRMIGCDSGGFDLRCDKKLLRQSFATPAADLTGLRENFMALSLHLSRRQETRNGNHDQVE